MDSQMKQIRDYLSNGGRLTQLDAIRKFRCLRLAAVVHSLRKSGMDIKTERIKNKNNKNKSYAVYSCDVD